MATRCCVAFSRREKLLEESKTWIMREHLDERIDIALKLPQALPYQD